MHSLIQGQISSWAELSWEMVLGPLAAPPQRPTELHCGEAVSVCLQGRKSDRFWLIYLPCVTEKTRCDHCRWDHRAGFFFLLCMQVWPRRRSSRHSAASSIKLHKLNVASISATPWFFSPVTWNSLVLLPCQGVHYVESDSLSHKVVDNPSSEVVFWRLLPALLGFPWEQRGNLQNPFVV